MSAIRPDSTIKLYNVPHLETERGFTYAFRTPAERESFMQQYALASEYPCTVIKKRNNSLKVSIPLATLEQCTHLSFVNPSYGDKIFYCRIVFTDYINNDVSLAKFEFDWYMTDMFNMKLEVTQMLRESLCRDDNVDMTNGEPISDKMLSEEPLLCDRRTEKLHYNIANQNAMYSEMGPDEFNDGWDVFTQGAGAYRQVDDHGNKLPSYLGIGGEFDGTKRLDDENLYVLCFPKLTDENVQTQINQRIHNIMTEWHCWFVYHPDKIEFNGTECYAASRFKQPELLDYNHYRTYGTTQPLIDTRIARPYIMVASSDINNIQYLVDYLNTLDATSDILSLYAVPSNILREFTYTAFKPDTIVGIANPSRYNDEARANLSFGIPYPNVVPGRFFLDVGQYSTFSKLDYFPFTYLSVDGPNDSGHLEFKFEKFRPMKQSLTGGDAAFNPYMVVFKKIVSMTADGCYAGVVPVAYEDFYLDKALGANTIPSDWTKLRVNLAKGLFYTDFPQVPYTTDAYMTFLAKQAKSLAIADTEYSRLVAGHEYGILAGKKALNKIGAIQDYVDTAANGAQSIIGMRGAGNRAANADMAAMEALNNPDASLNSFRGAVNNWDTAQGGVVSAGIAGAQTGMSFLSKGASRGLANQQLDNAMEEMVRNRQILNDAGDLLSGQAGNVFSDNYARAAKAFVNEEYHKGSCEGVLNLIRDAEAISPRITIKRRSATFMALYERFFQFFGYATKQVKVPGIVWYLRNNQLNKHGPRFSQVLINNADDPYAESNTGYRYMWTFYTQTENVHVSGVSKESANYIENMFNGGVLFIEGFPQQIFH